MSPEQVKNETPALSKPNQTAHLAVGASENVDRIREILFGSQMREYGQRFSQLEERLLRETGELRQEVRLRLDSLEAYTRQEVEALSDRLRIERDERTERIDRMARDAVDSTRGLEKRLAQSDEQVAKDIRELRQSLLDRHRALSDELTQCLSKLELFQNRRLEELRGSSVDRAALASLLGEVALRIQGEPLVSGMEDNFSAGAGR